MPRYESWSSERAAEIIQQHANRPGGDGSPSAILRARLSARQTTRTLTSSCRRPGSSAKDHMEDYLALSKLIEDTYDAVLDAGRWTGVLAKITDFVDGHAGGLLSKDSVSKSGNAYQHFNVDPH